MAFAPSNGNDLLPQETRDGHAPHKSLSSERGFDLADIG